MLDRLARIQLVIFAIVTVLTVGAIAVYYMHLPAKLGLGAYNVTAEFVAGGGLYKNANVAYRGVTIGRVESVTLANDGVDAHMRLNSDVKVPANATATVKSVSAVGALTMNRTALGAKVVGDKVNLEADLIGKYVEKFVTARR